eukprot:9228608-Ditylum_brightwellii.AAC.1
MPPEVEPTALSLPPLTPPARINYLHQQQWKLSHTNNILQWTPPNSRKISSLHSSTPFVHSQPM